MASRKPLLAVVVTAFCLASLHSTRRARAADASGDIIAEGSGDQTNAEGRFLQNAANEFFIGFTSNDIDDAPTLQLFVTTTEPNPVNFFVETLTGVNLTGTATQNSTTTISLPSSIQVSSNTERNKGIHVRAEGEKDIVVYGLNYADFTSDAFLALPCPYLDVDEYEYYAITYYDTSGDTPSTILLVGCEDNTTVTTSFGTLLLNKQETYYIGEDRDLTGTRVVANKPISFLCGHYCSDVPSTLEACDHLTEQVPPTASWGRFFLVASLLGRTSGEIYRIIAAHDSTEVTVNCNTLAQPLTLTLNNAGNWQEIQLNADSFCAFESNNPILIMQFALGRESDGVGDPFMTMVPAVEQYSNNYVVSVLEQFGANYITVAVAPRYFQPEQIFVDSSNLASVTWFTAYCFDGSVCGNIARMPIQPGEHQLYHEDTNARLGITVYGFNRYNSYGYIGGLQLVPQFVCVPSCENGNCTGPDRCTCNSGWIGPTCGTVDDGCALISLINCHANASCINTAGNFSCICNTGFTGNGVFCSEVEVFPPLLLNTERLSGVSLGVRWEPLTSEEQQGIVTSYTVFYAERRNELQDCHTIDLEDAGVHRSFTAEQNQSTVVIEDLIADHTYCVGVAANTLLGRTDISEARFVPLFTNTAFQLHLDGVGRCDRWVIDDGPEKLQETERQIASAVNEACNCEFSESYIASTSWLLAQCLEVHPNQVVFQGKIVSKGNYSSVLLVNLMQTWVRGGASMTVQGVHLTTDPSCEVAVPNLNSTDHCHPTMSTTTTTDYTVYIIVAVIGVLVLIGLVPVILFCIFIARTKKMKLYHLQHPFQGIITNSIPVTSGQPPSRYDIGDDSGVNSPDYAEQHQHEQQMEHVCDYIGPKQLGHGRQEEPRYVCLEELELPYMEMRSIQPGGEEQLAPELQTADKNPEGVDKKLHESVISHRRLAAVLLT